MTAKAKHDPPLKVPMKFDEAMKRVLKVKPPPEGWAAYEKKQKAEKKPRAPKSAA